MGEIRQIDKRLIKFRNGIVKNVKYTGGCNGNLQGIARLVEGMRADEVIQKCSGIHCGYKTTSCPDQLAKALKIALDKQD